MPYLYCELILEWRASGLLLIVGVEPNKALMTGGEIVRYNLNLPESTILPDCQDDCAVQ